MHERAAVFGQAFAWLALVSGCGGQLVAVKLPKDPSPQAHYVCKPNEAKPSFDCESNRAFHQYDRELVVSRETCAEGVANVYVETNWQGKVTRIQYTCALPPVEDFPKP